MVQLFLRAGAFRAGFALPVAVFLALAPTAPGLASAQDVASAQEVAFAQDAGSAPTTWLAALPGGHAVDLPARPDPGGGVPPPVPLPPDRVRAPEPPAWRRSVQGTYRLAWRREGQAAGTRGELEQQLAATWRDGQFHLYSQWTRRLATEGDARREGPDAPGYGIAARLTWDRPPWPALAGSSVRFGMRPLATRDPFRLFHPESGDEWRWAAQLRLGPAPGAPGPSWEAAYHRAEGSARGDEATWWQVAGPVGSGGSLWRFTQVEGGRPGRDPYRAWALDVKRDGGWGTVTAGYARRAAPLDDPYRAAGFARIQTRRLRGWTAMVEVHRRDRGFRLPIGGDLPWKEGTEGASWRLRYSRAPWEWQWEGSLTRALPADGAGAGSPEAPAGWEREPAYQLVWRPARHWSLRLRYEGSSSGQKERYEAQVRWPRSGLSLLGRFDAPTARWRWRLERRLAASRLRLDWDDEHKAWRAEFRREWLPYEFRIVYKERDDPKAAASGPGPAARQKSLFFGGKYRHPRGWGLEFTLGWDDRGRIDFHWNRPSRWELAWETSF